jgi:anti-anti-sigma factor
MSLQICESTNGPAAVLALAGRLDGLTAPEVEARVDQLIAGGSRRLVVDCAALTYVSSAGLRAFLAAAKRMQVAGGRCAFAALTPAVRELFTISGFASVMEIHETVAHACAQA